MIRSKFCSVYFGMAAVCLASMASAAEMMQHLPPGANAVLSIDVPAVLDSPLAKEQGWRNLMTKGDEDRPLPVPADAKQVTSAAQLNLTTFLPRWQASLVELSQPFNAERLAAARKGYVDKIGDKDVVFTPGDTVFAKYDKDTVAVFWPGQRQPIARWINNPAKSAGLEPSLVDALKDPAPYVLTIDTSDAYSTAGIFQAIRNGGFTSLDKFEGDIGALSKALASFKQVKVSAKFARTIQGEAVFTFGEDVSAVGPYAKQLVMDAVAEAGLDASGLSGWSFSVSGSEIKGGGAISESLFKSLTALFTPPAQPAELPGGDDKEAKPADGSATATASAAYYKSLTVIVDNLNFKQPALSQTGAYLRSQALRIDRLPILNVDPALVAWAGRLSETMNRAAQDCVVGQNKALVASDSVGTPTATMEENEYGVQSTTTAESRAAFRNAQQQRRQAGTAQRTDTLNQIASTLNDAIAPRTSIRQAMTEKYKVNF